MIKRIFPRIRLSAATRGRSGPLQSQYTTGTSGPGARMSSSQRTYSESAQNTLKSFKSSTFALPKDSAKIPTSSSDASVGSGSIQSSPKLTDFDMTQLIRGETDLKIAITDRAKSKLITIAKGERGSDSALKVKVESGGCHGFQYNFELTSLKEELEKNEELAVFQRTDSDMATLIFDESSLEILQDSKLDYTKELIGSSFKMVDSPYTSTSCGCGASFDFDFEKLEKAKSGAT